MDEKHFVKMQEACWKDVEQAFGVLQSLFAIVSWPAWGWKHHNLRNVMKACKILHNMIVEDEQESYIDYSYDHNPFAITTPVEVSQDGQILFSEFSNNFHNMRDLEKYLQLQQDIIKHQWDVKGRMEGEE
jgi:hypothetical protein